MAKSMSLEYDAALQIFSVPSPNRTCPENVFYSDPWCFALFGIWFPLWHKLTGVPLLISDVPLSTFVLAGSVPSHFWGCGEPWCSDVFGICTESWCLLVAREPLLSDYASLSQVLQKSTGWLCCGLRFSGLLLMPYEIYLGDVLHRGTVYKL